MTPVTVAQSEGWKEVSAVSCDVQNRSPYHVQVMPSSTTPLESDIGYLFAPYQMEQFDLSNGDKLYVKNDNAQEIKILTKAV